MNTASTGIAAAPGTAQAAPAPRSPLDFRDALAAVATRMVREVDIGCAVRATLADIGAMLEADRVLVTRGAWAADGVMTEIVQWQRDGLATWSDEDTQARIWSTPWMYDEIRARRPVVVRDPGALAGVAPRDHDHLVRTRVSWLAVLPLCVGEAVIGALFCCRYAGGMQRPLADDALQSLGVVANMMTTMMHQATLREDLERRVAAERGRMARELHGVSTQLLFSQTLFARSARLAFEDGDTGKLLGDLAQIEHNAVSALREVRLLLYDLRPASGACRDLARCVEERLELVERRLGINATLRAPTSLGVRPDVEEAMREVVMEALNNVLRHAACRSVSVDVATAADAVRVEIADDGCGFDPERPSSGMGVSVMRERTAAVGGTLEIASTPGAGTRVRLLVPAARARTP